MIDVFDDEVLTIAEAANRLPGSPAQSTIWRWIRYGCKGVRLEVLHIGGKTYTSRRAIQQFAEAITSVTAQAEAKSEPTSPAGHNPASSGTSTDIASHHTSPSDEGDEL